MSQTEAQLLACHRSVYTRFATFGCALLVVCALLSGVRVSAQATSGVTGVVTDSSGGIVIGAKVTLTDPGTGFSTTAQTNGLGVYQFSQVPPGEHYTLTITNENFRTLTIRDVALAVGTKETRDVELQVGDTKTTVEVNSQGETTLNTTDASIGTIVDGDRVQDLPSLFVDNAAALLRLAPGVVSGATDTSQEGATTGTRGDQANITLDGLDINDERGGFAFITAVNTPLDSIQELKTTVAGNDASYGHSAGGQVELVTKSGTNNFHGQAYDLNRVTAFAANNFFNNLNKIPKPPLIRNQFGGDVGGPILKNKVFFFFTYNGLRAKSSQQINDVVPLDALRHGQLNYINSNAGCGASSNIVSTPSCISTTPLTGPNSLKMLDPSGIGADQALLNLIRTRPYPEPNNFNTGDLINSAGFGFAAPVGNRDNTFVGRLDYQISTNHRLFARGTWDRSVDDDSANHFARTFPGDPIEAIIVDHSRSWVVGHTWTISPSIINQASFGETNETLVFPLASAPTFPNLLSFFFNGSVLTAPFDNDINGNPTLNEQFPVVPVYQIRDTLSWTKGKHTLQFGGLIKPTIFHNGNLTDTNTFTVGLGGQLTALTSSLRPSNLNGDGAAVSEWDSFFPLALGRFASVNAGFNYNKAGNPIAQGTVPIRDYHSTEYEFFGQDTWNIRSDLTMTYGLRWEFHNPLSEVNGFEAVPNLSAKQIFATRLKDAAAGIEGPNAVPFVSYGLGGSANNAPGYYKPSYTNFAPRLGLAYSPSFTKGFLGHLFGDRKTSIRTGFGINYDVNLIGQGFELDETSFLFSNSVVNSFGGGGAAAAFGPGGDPRFSGFSSLPAVPPAGTTPRPKFTPNVDANGVPIGFNTNFG
ncbi:MAG: TonB-dependent receptor, partial [Candidatus Acidiferrales bacterium]